MKTLYFALLFFWASAGFAQDMVSGMRVWHSPDKTRMVFDVSSEIDYQIHYEPAAKQAVLIFKNTQAAQTLKKELDKVIAQQNLLKIHAERRKSDYYVAFDVKEAVRVKSFVASPNKEYGYRLIVDLPLEKEAKQAITYPDKITVMIDAGHGGEDGGATGSQGTKEKQVTLSIAKKLQQLLRKQKNIQVHMVRTSDYFVRLKKRSEKSKAQNSDIFISIHADKYKDARVSGASVYVYSDKKGRTEMSRWLEQLEEDSDSVGGNEKRHGVDDIVSGILLDLELKANRSHSLGLGKQILRSLKPVAKLHSRVVQKANFSVLRNSGVPSVLVETGFISNPDEELNLKSDGYQQEIAEAIATAIKSYLKGI